MSDEKEKAFLHKGTILKVAPMKEVHCDCGRVSFNSTGRCDNVHCSASQDLPVKEVKGLHKPGDATAEQVHFVIDKVAASDAAHQKV